MPLAGLQMPGCVHSFVQYPHYDHCASFNPVVDGVVFHPLSPIPRPNVVASRRRLRRLCKRIEAGVQLVQVTLGLGHTGVRVHFGLGDRAAAQKLQVVWPGGKTQEVQGPIAANTLVVVKQLP